MNRIRAGVIATLLGVWCFPMVSSAKALSSEPASLAAKVGEVGEVSNLGTTGGPEATPSSDSEAVSLATREQQARHLQDFKGGGVTIYIGSGVLLIVLIILLILLI
jgi:hypothetical protein